MPKKPNIKPGDWTKLTLELEKNEHVRQQVRRIMDPLRLMRGTSEAMSFEEALRIVCQQLAILIEDPEVESCANHGGIQVVRSVRGVGGGGYPDNYSIMLFSAEVYGFQMWGADETKDMGLQED